MTDWDKTQAGADLNSAFAQAQYCYATAMPAHIAALKTLSEKPISG